MSMAGSKIVIERGKSLSEPVVVRPTELFKSNRDLPVFEKALLNLLTQDFRTIIVDLGQVDFPSTSFIAFLIEINSRVRRENRRFFISNLTEMARMNMTSFSPLGFLQELEKSDSEEKDSFHEPELVQPDLTEREAIDEIVGTTTEPPGSKEPALDFDFDIVDSPKLSEEDLDRPLTLFDIDEENLPEEKSEKSLPKAESEFHIVVRSREKELYRITDFVVHHAQVAGFDETDVGKLKIAVYEAAINVVEHAYEYNPNHLIDVIVKYDARNFTIVLMDRGKSFDFDRHLKPYSADEAAERKQTGGFGLHIIQRSMDSVTYDTDPVWGNRLTMVKKIPSN